jgi:regulator of replication initiation timing
LNALELEQLKDEVGQLKRENAGLKEKLQEMQHEIEAVQTLSEKQLRKAILEIKLEQLEMGKRVERIYQAEERRQLKGSAQAPFHLIAKIGEFLPSVVAVDQETDEK